MVRVLVVDDELAFCSLLSLLLLRHGFEVRTALNSDEAMLAARSYRPEVVIVDRLLGERTDGLQLLAGIRNCGVDCRAIVISGYPDDRPWNPPEPADVFISKPFEPDRLLEAVQSLVRYSRPPGMTLRSEVEHEHADRTRC